MEVLGAPDKLHTGNQSVHSDTLWPPQQMEPHRERQNPAPLDTLLGCKSRNSPTLSSWGPQSLSDVAHFEAMAFPI